MGFVKREDAQSPHLGTLVPQCSLAYALYPTSGRKGQI